MKKRFIWEKIVNITLILVIIVQVIDLFSNANNQDYSIFYTKANNPNIVLAGAKDITIPTEDEILAGMSTKEIFNYYIKKQKYIMHAGGTIDNKYYTNSLEALTQNYQSGNRIFEIDLNFTSDGHLVLIHGWTEYDYKYRLGLTYDEKNPIMDLKTFKKAKLYNKYTTMTIEDLINFMKKNPYSYFILNIKNGSDYKVSTKAIKQIIKAANYNKNILNRFVVWGYNTKVVSKIKQLYNFELIALNVKNYKKMEKNINSEIEILDYCKKNKISIIMYQYNDFNVSLTKSAKLLGIETFIYTIDNDTFAKSYFKNEATMAFTNKLRN